MYVETSYIYANIHRYLHIVFFRLILSFDTQLNCDFLDMAATARWAERIFRGWLM